MGRSLSLAQRLSFFWLFTVIVTGALIYFLQDIYHQGAGSSIDRASGLTSVACAELQSKFKWAVDAKTFSANRETEFQRALLEIVLSHYDGVEGGFWNEQHQFTSYSYPTYEGSGVKRDVPEAEKENLARASRAALEKNSAQVDLHRGQREATIVTACPLKGALAPSVAWTMTRTPTALGLAYDRLIIGLCLLLAFVISFGLLTTVLLHAWSKNLRRLESQLTDYSVLDLPQLPPTQEVELNRIVSAFNNVTTRLATERTSGARFARQIAQNDRLAAIGRMAAGLAHEIRNPLATMRLKIENAEVAPQERMPKAAPVLLEQIGRVDRLVDMMLAMTKPFELRREPTEIAAWAESHFASLEKQASNKQIQFSVAVGVASWSFDRFHLARAVENLLANSVALTPAGGRIDCSFDEVDHRLNIRVSDTGPGLPPEIRDRLYEPFATAREGGTGLGLMLVREVAEAHGGLVRLEASSEHGTTFTLEIPWQKS